VTKGYLLDLRDQVGSRLLMSCGVVAIVRDEEGRILLHKRSDTNSWSFPGGGVEPGESPASAVVREVLEETGYQVEPIRIAAVLGAESGTRFVYPNGDVVEVVATVFECLCEGPVQGFDSSETHEICFFDPDSLPPIWPEFPLRALQLGLKTPWFEVGNGCD
jgi:8-oxo-dGTP pyrophosphatase MutT (NUDIX family)